MNPLIQLGKLGQSVWLDLLSRDLVRSGKLQQWIDNDGLSGLTSNPSIFEKAIGDTADYDDDIRRFFEQGKLPLQIYEELAMQDIREASDVLLPVYIRTGGDDGYASLEVSPLLARDTDGTIREARRLWSAVSRSNIFIKIPATPEGIPAIAECIAEGININITLLYGLGRYREVADAYLSGLEKRMQMGHSIQNVRSVASFFLSRIDVLVDEKVDGDLRGRTAIACAKVAYQMYQELFHSDRFQRLAQRGAHAQRLLWASTGTKSKEYSDVKYIEALIGPETISTIPVETLDAYRDHGNPQVRLKDDVEGERAVLSKLAAAGIDLDDVTEQLEGQGIEKFTQPFNKLMDQIARKAHALHAA